MMTLIVFVASLLVSAYFMSRMQAKNTIEAQDFQTITSNEGSTIPVVHGTVWTSAILVHNTPPEAYPITVEVGGIFGSSKTRTGYEYQCNLHLVLCLGKIDAIKKITADTKTVFSGSLSSGSRLIDKPSLFGDGDGYSGTLMVANGGFEHRLKYQGSLSPKYKGLTSVLFYSRDNYFTSQNFMYEGIESKVGSFVFGASPQLRDMRFMVQAVNSLDCPIELTNFRSVRSLKAVKTHNRVFIVIDISKYQGQSVRDIMRDEIKKIMQRSFDLDTDTYEYMLIYVRKGSKLPYTSYTITNRFLPISPPSDEQLENLLDEIDEDLIGDRQTIRPFTSLTGMLGQSILDIYNRGSIYPVEGARELSHFVFVFSPMNDYDFSQFKDEVDEFYDQMRELRYATADVVRKSRGGSLYSFRFIYTFDEYNKEKLATDEKIIYSIFEKNEGVIGSIFDSISSAGSSDAYNINPALMIYDCLTNKSYGAGIDRSQIDIASFASAAQTLYLEGFGLSMSWAKEGRIFDYIESIRSHIGAVLYEEPTSGLWTLKLIRDDYDFDSLLLLDESNCESVSGFERQAFSDRVSQINLTYTDLKNDKTAFVVVQDSALASATGKIVSKSVTYSGINDSAIASKVALRDLKQASTGLSSLQIKLPYSIARSLRQGDVVKLSWSEYGMVKVAMRIAELDLGDSKSGSATLSVIQDVFRLPTAGVTTEDTSFEDHDLSSFRPPEFLGMSLSYSISEMLGEGTGSDYGILAKKPKYEDDLSSSVMIYDMSSGVFPDSEDHSLSLSRGGRLISAISAGSASLSIDSDLPDGTYIFIGSSGDVRSTDSHEMMKIVSKEGSVIGGFSYSVIRGCDDTVPRYWAEGDDYFIFGDYMARGKTKSSDPSIAKYIYTVVPRNGQYQDEQWKYLDAHEIILANRDKRPMPPRNVRINNQFFPSNVLGDLKLSFTKAKKKSVADFSGWTDVQATEETDSLVTYTLDVFKDDAIIKTVTGISDGLVTIPEDQLLEGNLSVRLTSVKGSYSSYMSFEHAFSYTKVNMALYIETFTAQSLSGVTNELSSVTIDVDDSLSANFTAEQSGSNSIVGKAEAGATITIEVED